MREELLNTVVEQSKSADVLLQWATGVGKSRAAIDIHRQLKSDLQGIISVLLLVAERSHIKNWQAEYEKWESDDNLYGDITCVCYASFKKQVHKKWDLIIFDEAHHLSSDIRMELFSKSMGDKHVYMSATIDKELITLFEFIKHRPIYVSKFSLQDAIGAEVLATPKIVLHPLRLNNSKVSEEIIENWGLKKDRVVIHCDFRDRFIYRNRKKYPNVELHINCTQLEKYSDFETQIDYWKKRFFKSGEPHVKNKWMQLTIQRKRFLAMCKSVYTKNLLTVLNASKTRYICFCGSIEQSEYLNPDNSIHSKKKNSLQILEKFNNKEINSLITVNMLQEGQNLVDVEVGIITQLDGLERGFIQKFGRTLRSKNPVQHIIYFVDTRDADYLENVTSNVDKNLITKI